ncbi:hypothetical protein ACFL2T_04595 [Elusimicrobiota bacterium]
MMIAACVIVRRACACLCVAALLAGPAFGQGLVGEDPEVSLGPNTGSIDGGGQGLDGSGLQRDTRKDKEEKGSSKKEDEEESYKNWLPCSAADLGTDSLYKFPSEGTSDGIVFLPPKSICDGLNEDETRTLGVNATHVLLCATPFCTHKTLGFERIAGCFPRTREAPVRSKFNEGPLYVVLRLRDKRNLFWFIKDPYARNGAPPYPNLAHTIYPGCYRWK